MPAAPTRTTSRPSKSRPREDCVEGRGGALREPGAILLVSTYELGRQPLSLASPLAALEEAGFLPAALDLSVERIEPVAVRRARLVLVAVPMHTALRLGVQAAERIRSINPACRIALYGMYATLNAPPLLSRGADFGIGGGGGRHAHHLR